ncbi:MAG: tyrosine-protein phosphatase [Clostridia bacterium]|nr:tyrosine-protein phosphatase [Clostridia bacterium]
MSFSGSRQNGKLKITKGFGVVYPYGNEIRAYLESPFGSNVSDFYCNMQNQAKGITLAWENDEKNVKFVTLEYGEKSCEANKIVKLALDKNAKSYDLYNLLKDTEYEWQVSVGLENGEVLTAGAEFKTTELGPRFLNISQVYNTRDAGGWLTDDGKKTKCGLLYRGGELKFSLPKEADLVFQKLGIVVEIDLRGSVEENGYPTKSQISNARAVFVITDGYASAFSEKFTANFRKVFSLMANSQNYPMYVHCTGGADRTGTIIFLINALLGVSEDLLVKDYELTSFSIYGERSSVRGTTYGDMFRDFLFKLKSYEGENLSKKTENYMLSIGVTPQEISNIRSLFLD